MISHLLSQAGRALRCRAPGGGLLLPCASPGAGLLLGLHARALLHRHGGQRGGEHRPARHARASLRGRAGAHVHRCRWVKRRCAAVRRMPHPGGDAGAALGSGLKASVPPTPRGGLEGGGGDLMPQQLPANLAGGGPIGPLGALKRLEVDVHGEFRADQRVARALQRHLRCLINSRCPRQPLLSQHMPYCI